MPSYTVTAPAFHGGSMKHVGDIVDFPSDMTPLKAGKVADDKTLPSWVNPKPLGAAKAAETKKTAAQKGAETKAANAAAKKEQNAASGDQAPEDAVSFIDANAADDANGGTASL